MWAAKSHEAGGLHTSFWRKPHNCQNHDRQLWAMRGLRLRTHLLQQLLINRVAIGATGQEAHQGSGTGDIALGEATFAVATLPYRTAAFAVAAHAAAAGSAATCLSVRAPMSTVSAVPPVIGHVDAFPFPPAQHPFRGRSLDVAAFVPRAARDFGAAASIICL